MQILDFKLIHVMLNKFTLTRLVLRFSFSFCFWLSFVKYNKLLLSVGKKIKNFIVIYVVDITEVPDFNTA